SVVQPAEPSREKLAIHVGAFWSTLVAQPVSSRPEMVLLSICSQFLPLSELRHNPSPTILMVTSPFVRFTTTPEQPPGQTALAPLFVNRSSKGVEMSVHISAARDGAPSSSTTEQIRPPPRNMGDVKEKIVCINYSGAFRRATRH